MLKVNFNAANCIIPAFAAVLWFIGITDSVIAIPQGARRITRQNAQLFVQTSLRFRHKTLVCYFGKKTKPGFVITRRQKEFWLDWQRTLRARSRAMSWSMLKTKRVLRRLAIFQTACRALGNLQVTPTCTPASQPSPAPTPLDPASINTPIDLLDLTVPAERIPNWVEAGVDGGIPDTTNSQLWPVINAADYGANPDCRADPGQTNLTEFHAIQAALDAAQALYGDGRQGTVVYLPAGCYQWWDYGDWGGASLRVRSHVVLKGAGPDATVIESPSKAAAAAHITVGGTLGDTITVANGATRGSRSLELSSQPGFPSGTYLLIQEDADPAKFDHNPYNCYVSQVIRAQRIAGQTITLDRPLRDTFTLNTRVQVMEPAIYAGVENLRVQYPTSISDASGYHGLIKVDVAVNSWVKNVHLYWGDNWQLNISRSRDVTIESSLFEYTEYNAPVEMGGAGKAFNSHLIGVIRGATDTLVWNNILAHNEAQTKFECAPIGNVFAFNYSRDNQAWKAFEHLHGWYPAENLFEANVGDGASISDDWWGKQGPRNIFFRNRHLGSEYAGFTTHRWHEWGVGNTHSYIGNVGQNVFRAPFCEPPHCHDFDNSLAMTNLWAEKNRYIGTFVWYNTNPNPTTTYVPELEVCPQHPELCAGFVGPRIKTCNGHCYDSTGYDGRKPPAAWDGFKMPASLFLNAPPPFWCQELPWPAVGADVDDLDALNKLPAQRRDEGLPCTPRQ